MKISDSRLKELQGLYEAEYGVTLDRVKAREVGNALATLMRLTLVHTENDEHVCRNIAS